MTTKRTIHNDAIIIEEAFYGGIPNLGDFFSDDDVRTFIHDNYHVYFRERKRLKFKSKAIASFIDYFVSCHYDIRRCSICGKLFRSGYIIEAGDHYACSDECMISVYINNYGACDPDEAMKMFLCDCYCLDYNDHSDVICEMPQDKAEDYLSSRPNADDSNSETYFTKFA